MKKEALFYKMTGEGNVQCYLCSHRCRIPPSKFGVCGVRKNEEGRLWTYVYGEVIAEHIDPIEKKPLYHFLPGSSSYSIATMGCNFRCGFCQNWQISQLSKRDEERGTGVSGHILNPEDVIKAAKHSRCLSVSYTYTEPTIFFEYAYDIARLAKENGLCNNFVTNGYITEEALQTIKPYLDACNVDLKSFREDFYTKVCNAHLEPVLNSIRHMRKLGIWVEITTLVVPGKNDSDEEFNDIAGFIASVGCEVPWHISRFHPDYKYMDLGSTPIGTLIRAKEIGKKAGLRYIYWGNVLGGNNTYCYNCQELLIERVIFDVTKITLNKGNCPKCGAVIDGLLNIL